MKKNMMNSFEINTMQYFLMRACIVGIMIQNVIRLARQDSWLVIILGTIVGLIPLGLYLYLNHHYPEDSIIEIVNHCFGKKVGKIMNVLVILFIFAFTLVIFWNLVNFISSQYLPKTPSLPIAIMFLLPMIYLLFCGIKVIGRTSTILFFISVTFLLLSSLGLFSQVNLSNLTPVLENGMGPVIGGIGQYLVYSVAPLFLLLIIPKKDIADAKHFKKQTIICFLLTSLSLLDVIIFITTIFGLDLALLYQYPAFHILKRVSIVGFITRIESTLSVQWMLTLFMALVLCLYYMCEGIKRTFSVKKEKLIKIIKLVIPFSAMFASLYVFPNNTSGNVIVLKYLPLCISFVFIIFPFILFLLSQKKRSKKITSS